MARKTIQKYIFVAFARLKCRDLILSWFQAEIIQFGDWRWLARAQATCSKSFPTAACIFPLFLSQASSLACSAWHCTPPPGGRAPRAAPARQRSGHIPIGKSESSLAVAGRPPARACRLAGAAGRSAHAALHDSFDGTDARRDRGSSCRRVVYSAAAAAAAFVTLSLRYDFCIVGQGRRRR